MVSVNHRGGNGGRLLRSRVGSDLVRQIEKLLNRPSWVAVGTTPAPTTRITIVGSGWVPFWAAGAIAGRTSRVGGFREGLTQTEYCVVEGEKLCFHWALPFFVRATYARGHPRDPDKKRRGGSRIYRLPGFRLPPRHAIARSGPGFGYRPVETTLSVTALRTRSPPPAATHPRIPFCTS